MEGLKCCDAMTYRGRLKGPGLNCGPEYEGKPIYVFHRGVDWAGFRGPYGPNMSMNRRLEESRVLLLGEKNQECNYLLEDCIG